MSIARDLNEITIKVPAPFAGIEDLGFSARYAGQSRLQPSRDVPLWIEGPAEPMRRLAARLRVLAAEVERAYGWTQPVMLTDEVVVMAFQDRSLHGHGLTAAAGALDYVMNLVRPVVFPFLQDCVRVGHLRLTEEIQMSVQDSRQDIAELWFSWDQIVAANGDDLLSA